MKEEDGMLNVHLHVKKEEVKLLFIISTISWKSVSKKVSWVGEAAKKSSYLNGRDIKEKGTFFKILLTFKNKNYFTLDNLSKYRHITLMFDGRYFYWVVTIISKE